MSYPQLQSPIQWSSRLIFTTPQSYRSPPLSNNTSNSSLAAHVSSEASNDSSTSQPKFPRFPSKFTDKIYLPPSVLQALIDKSGSAPLPTPLTFKITNPATNQFTHVGVREFSAPEGTAQLPSNIADRIGLSETQQQQPILIQLVELPKATSLVLSLEDSSYDVDDWKALLEAQLQSTYTTLTKGDTLLINDPSDMSKHYKCLVSDLKPADSALIVDTDIDLEIIPPLNAHNTESSSKGKSKSGGSKIHNGDNDTIDLGSFNLANNTNRIDLPLEQNLVNSSRVKFTIQGWNNTSPINISLKDIDPQNCDPNLVNIFATKSEFDNSPQAYIWSTVSKSTDLRERTLTISQNDPFLQQSQSQENLEDKNNLIYVTIVVEGAPESDFDNVTLHIYQGNSQETSSSSAEIPVDSTQCPNCKQIVPQRSFQLHSTFCERNNIPCPKGCGQIFLRREGIPKAHWHCDECANEGLAVFGNTLVSHELHNSQVHTPAICQSCYQSSMENPNEGLQYEFSNNTALALHKATVCPAKLHICRFCHLKVAQGVASPADMLEGYTGHESFCGSRTTNCDNCRKAVRLRDLANHMKFHEIKRLSNKTSSRLCSNVNCLRAISEKNTSQQPPLGLCSICFGPLHNTTYDPTGSKLKSRIERRYMIQLTRGCGKSFCTNYDACFTANPVKLKMADVMVKVKELMQPDPNDPSKLKVIKFCVDETATKRKMFIDLISQVEMLYSPEWAAEAIDIAKGNEAEARRWLENNAVKLSEQQND